jgi:hypothetical protein
MNKKKHNLTGGKVIDSGGYGCVFKPALKCYGSKKRTNGISKLGIKKESLQEWDNLLLVKKYISKIPNYNRYFLLSNLDKCAPAPLTKNDLNDFQKCEPLIQYYNITANNINDNLQELNIINMPYGGLSLYEVIRDHRIPIATINIIMITLLVRGILPMNKLHLYHFDLKSSNLLYKNGLIRIIDYGAIGISTPFRIIPSTLLNRRVQFNSPFSRILFTDFFDEQLDFFLKNKKLNPSSPLLFKTLQLFVLQFYRSYRERYGLGHEPYLRQDLLPAIFRLDHRPPPNFDIFADILSRYCAQALIKYINFTTNSFDKEKYFIEVYSKNVDVYGFIIAYAAIITSDDATADKRRWTGQLIQPLEWVQPNQRIGIDTSLLYRKQKIIVANIIIKYCLSDRYANIPINLYELINDLKELTTLKQNNILNLELLLSKSKSKKSKSKKSKSKKSKSKKSKSKKSKSKSKSKKSKSKSKSKKSKKLRSKSKRVNI